MPRRPQVQRMLHTSAGQSSGVSLRAGGMPLCMLLHAGTVQAAAPPDQSVSLCLLQPVDVQQLQVVHRPGAPADDTVHLHRGCRGLRHADAAQPCGQRELLSSQLGLTAGSRSVLRRRMCATCTILGALHTHPACQGGIACQSLPFSCKVHTSPVKAAGNINLCSACASQQGSQPLQRPLAQCLRTSSCSRRIHLHSGTLQLNAAEPHRRQHSGKPITVLKQVQPASRWQTPLFSSLAVSQELPTNTTLSQRPPRRVTSGQFPTAGCRCCSPPACTLPCQAEGQSAPWPPSHLHRPAGIVGPPHPWQ